MTNLFDLPLVLPNNEVFESLLSSKNILIERIISRGQTTPTGQWYDQDKDEWVILLQGEAELSYEDGSKIMLKKGDYLLIGARQKHRVEYTSANPPCIWLAIHGNFFV
ncbi:MAG: cupin domain-containing protein [Hydrococcus sp. Prado102]|jgi:cupin 2 domain-containing protein|nr:cupin domain-containing protein [Hydrococcus sp. Prado102]